MHGHFRHTALPIATITSPKPQQPADDDNKMDSDQSAVKSLFGCVLLFSQIHLTIMCRSTIPSRFIWSICYGN